MTWRNAILAGALMLVSVGARSQTTVEAVFPDASEDVPTNTQFWVVTRGMGSPPLTVTFEQSSGAIDTVRTGEGECCFAYQVPATELEPGVLGLIVDPPDGAEFESAYQVTDAVDVEPPFVAAPLLQVRNEVGPGGWLVSGGGYLVTATIPEMDDDWGIVAVVPEFNSRRMTPVLSGSLNPAAEWERDSPLLGMDEILQGTVGVFQGHQVEGCARMTAFDVGGNAFTSETTCVNLGQPEQSDPLAPFEEIFCDCSSVGRRSPPATWAVGLLVLVLVHRKTRRSRSLARQ